MCYNTIEPSYPQDSRNSTPHNTICATKFNPDSEVLQKNPAVIPTVTVITTGSFFLLVISVLVCALVYYKKRKQKQSDHHISRFTTQDNSVVLQYNTCYSQFDITKHGPHADHRHSHVTESTHSYVINSLGLSFAESGEEQYWQPASKEEDLKHQFKKLKVDEILKDNIV